MSSKGLHAMTPEVLEKLKKLPRPGTSAIGPNVSVGRADGRGRRGIYQEGSHELLRRQRGRSVFPCACTFERSGQLWLRLGRASLCGSPQVLPGVLPELSPLQTGVGIRDATTHTALGATHLLPQVSSSKGFGFLQVDLVNAFNNVSRDAILRQTQRLAPMAYPWELVTGLP